MGAMEGYTYMQAHDHNIIIQFNTFNFINALSH